MSKHINYLVNIESSVRVTLIEIKYHMDSHTKIEAPAHTFDNLAKYFLLSAEICLSERLYRKYKLNDSNQGLDNGGILMPIFYLIKHALELFVKSFNIICTGNNNAIHETQSIWDGLKEKLLSRSGDITEKIKLFDTLLVRYRRLNFGNASLLRKSDRNNTALRYPDAALEKLNLLELTSVKSEDVIRDIGEIRTCARFIFSYLQINL